MLARAAGRPPPITGRSAGVTVTTTSCAAASPRSPARQPSSPASASAASAPRVEADPGAVAGRGQAAGRPGAVDAAADQPRPMPASVARQRLRRDRRGRAGAQRGDRGAVHDRQQLAGLGAGDQQRPGDHRQAALGVARERGHPLQRRQPVAARRHRPEVAVGRRVDVDLRRHHPLAGRVALEGGPRALDRLRAAETAASTASRVEDRDLGHRASRLDSRPMSGTNGKRKPPRPRIELVSPAGVGERGGGDRRRARAVPRRHGAGARQRRARAEPVAARRARGGDRRPPGERLGMGARAAIEHLHRPRSGPGTQGGGHVAVVKIIELVGSSKTSTDDAAKQALTQASVVAAQHPRRRHRLDRDPRREPRRVPRPRAGRVPDRGHRRRLSDAAAARPPGRA